MNPLTLIGLLQEPRFLVGAGFGCLSAVVVLAAPRKMDWFVAWALAAVIALAMTDFPGWPPEVAPWMLGIAMITVVAVLLGGVSLFRRTEPWVPPTLFALAVLAVWGTVPDTEHARVLMGVTSALMIAALGPKGPRWTILGLGLASAILAYTVLVDGWARDSAVVGACGAVGMLVVAPIVLGLRGRRSVRGGKGGSHRRRPATQLDSWALVAAQVVLVILSGRVAGQAQSVLLATSLLVMAYAAVGSGWALATGWRERWRGRRPGSNVP